MGIRLLLLILLQMTVGVSFGRASNISLLNSSTHAIDASVREGTEAGGSADNKGAILFAVVVSKQAEDNQDIDPSTDRGRQLLGNVSAILRNAVEMVGTVDRCVDGMTAVKSEAIPRMYTIWAPLLKKYLGGQGEAAKRSLVTTLGCMGYESVAELYR